MITKSIIAEKLLRKLFGGDYPTSRTIDPRDIYLEAETAYAYVVQKYINITGDDISSEFITTYEDVPVLKNTNRNRLYSILPAQLISLNNGGGLRQVSGVKDEGDVFIQMRSGDEGIFYGLEANSLGGKTGYWLEGDRIIYKNLPAYYEGKTVLVKMISSIYSLPEDEFIPIPAGVETEFEDLVYTRLLPQKQTPKDKINDNTQD